MFKNRHVAYQMSLSDCKDGINFFEWVVCCFLFCTEFGLGGLGEKELCRTKISLQGLVVFLTINFDLVNVEGPSG